MIRLESIMKTYGDGIMALEDIHLEIARGEFLFIVGPTGAGKTTLLKLLYLAEFPTQGEVFLFDRGTSLLTKEEIALLRRKIGVVFQDFKLLGDRTISENVSFALEILGEDPKLVLEKTHRILANLGLSRKFLAYPEQLSGGEAQRASLARALVREPLLLLADEPTGNLDENTASEIIHLLRTAHLKGTTVLLATHNRALLPLVPHARVINLSGGKLR